MRLSALIVLASLIPAALSADPVDDILDEARSFCEGVEDGNFDAGDAVSEVNLDGEGEIDRIVDESRFTCSTSASAFCGSGGCALHAVVGDRKWTYQATGWRMIDWDGYPILLIGRDGGWCGGAGSQVCFEAVNWSAGEALTVMPSN